MAEAEGEDRCKSDSTRSRGEEERDEKGSFKGGAIDPRAGAAREVEDVEEEESEEARR